MTPEQQKEQISIAYLHAVAARERCKIGTWSVDDGCLDASIGFTFPPHEELLGEAQLNVQLKATSDSSVLRDDHVAWALSRAHYDRLRARAAVTRLLVVLLLPADPAEWIEHTPEQLILRRCAYWVKMTGQPPRENESKVTVHIPRSQVFSPRALRNMLEQIRSGESP